MQAQNPDHNPPSGSGAATRRVSRHDPRMFGLRLSGAFLVATILAACATVKVEPPTEPIEINLNVKIDGELRVKLDKEIEEALEENPEIFF